MFCRGEEKQMGDLVSTVTWQAHGVITQRTKTEHNLFCTLKELQMKYTCQPII